MLKLVVLSIVLASVAASGIAPLWGGHLAAPWGGHLAAPWGAAIAAPIAAPIAAAPLAPVGAYNYRGPLSLAPGQPANILAHDGRPLDTLSVNVDRAIHYTAKALDHGGAHLLKKRSVVAPWAAAPWAVAAPAAAWSHSARIDVPAARVIGPAPVALAAAAHVAPWGLGHGARLGHLW
ncbi:uncharacterized protein LOC125069336 [Vanessa atalanta]|uniref:uncharacterized protein LOC125069336 n=1 Tax=Vanessa atalanta TaxID=42275 RepID=UPI001FCCF561|nr:uncharacterized protein LOC125069336 [Vanessa atalanta]